MSILVPASPAVSRPIRARCSMAALRHNVDRVRALAPASRAWMVVKANAYGHGQDWVVDALREEADGFALLECERAVALRERGITQPLLLLEGIFAERDAREVARHGLTTVVHCREQLDMLLAGAGTAPLSIFLKLNTGMNRLGFRGRDFLQARERLLARPATQITLMTHFAEADGGRGIAAQLASFRDMAGDWRGPVSLANSAAIFDYPETHADWVRPGIMLYGASPFAGRTAASLGLRPVMTLDSAIIAVQTLTAGELVGYGGTFRAERDLRVGIVACGYADGYPRHAPTGTPIAVAGRLTRTLGRVSMDMLACDLTDLPEAGPGAPVTLWGEGAGGVVPADDVAAAAGTIAYELFCAVSPRVPLSGVA